MKIKDKMKENIADKKHRSVFFKLLSFKAPKLRGGFTLLFASLIGALVLAVGLAILSIALKQLQLSSAGRESQKAFFSADAGVECALYLDRGGMDPDCKLGFFGTPSTTAQSVDVCGGNTPSAAFIECFGKRIDIISDGYSAGINAPFVVSRFILNDQNQVGGGGGDNHDMCFNVDVKKIVDNTPSNGTDDTKTIIESRGYNTCTDSINRYERAIRVENF